MTKEIQEKLDALFEMLKTPRKDSTIDIFKTAVREMMDFVYQRDPSMVQTWLDDLGAVEWQNYITRKEAEAIISKMVPAAPWKYDVWQAAMTKLGIPMEEEPYYNACALWCEMNKQYSDHAQSLADKVWKKPLSTISAEDIVPAIHALAIDVLRDKDGIYNIRSYFGL